MRDVPSVVAPVAVESLGEPQRIILRAIDGVRSLAEIAEATHNPDFPVAKLVFDLLESGHLDLSSGFAPPRSSELTPEDPYETVFAEAATPHFEGLLDTADELNIPPPPPDGRPAPPKDFTRFLRRGPDSGAHAARLAGPGHDVDGGPGRRPSARASPVDELQAGPARLRARAAAGDRLVPDDGPVGGLLPRDGGPSLVRPLASRPAALRRIPVDPVRRRRPPRPSPSGRRSRPRSPPPSQGGLPAPPPASPPSSIAVSAIPSLTRPMEELMSWSFTPNEAFILSRINGLWDVRSIAKISPFPEGEVRRVFEKLHDGGLIRWR